MQLPEYVTNAVVEWANAANEISKEVVKMKETNEKGEEYKDYDKETFVMAIQESVNLGQQLLDTLLDRKPKRRGLLAFFARLLHA